MINASLIEFDSDKEILPNVERLSKIDITPADLKKYDMVTIENLNKVSPEIAKIDNYLGVIYSIEGDTAKARERFELSLQIWPDNADARKNLQILRQQQ
jgi:lipoprotein NlpI